CAGHRRLVYRLSPSAAGRGRRRAPPARDRSHDLQCRWHDRAGQDDERGRRSAPAAGPNGEQGRDEVKTIRQMMLGAAASALVLTSVAAPAALAQSTANQVALVDYVNPLMGTDSSYRLSYG